MIRTLRSTSDVELSMIEYNTEAIYTILCTGWRSMEYYYTHDEALARYNELTRTGSR